MLFFSCEEGYKDSHGLKNEAFIALEMLIYIVYIKMQKKTLKTKTFILNTLISRLQMLALESELIFYVYKPNKQ